MQPNFENLTGVSHTSPATLAASHGVPNTTMETLLRALLPTVFNKAKTQAAFQGQPLKAILKEMASTGIGDNPEILFPAGPLDKGFFDRLAKSTSIDVATLRRLFPSALDWILDAMITNCDDQVKDQKQPAPSGLFSGLWRTIGGTAS